MLSIFAKNLVMISESVSRLILGLKGGMGIFTCPFNRIKIKYILFNIFYKTIFKMPIRMSHNEHDDWKPI